MRTAPLVELNAEQRAALEHLARARIVLLAAEGLQDKQIARRTGIMPEKAARRRFLQGGIPALEKDAPRPGRTRIITDRRVKKVVEMTLHHKPANATHWSTRTM